MCSLQTPSRRWSGLAMCIALSTMLGCSPSRLSNNAVQPQGPSPGPESTIGLPLEWTATPTSAPTAALTITPTPTLTPTSTPQPPSTLAVEELPDGFEETTFQAVGLDITPLSSHGFGIIGQSAFRHRDNHMTVVSVILELGGEDSQQVFDQTVSSVEEAKQIFVIELGLYDVADPIQLPWYRPRGTTWIGLRTAGRAAGIVYGVDLGAYRRGEYGRVIVLMRPEGASRDFLNISDVSTMLED